MKIRVVTAGAFALSILTQCSPYSGTAAQTKVVSISYGTNYRTETKQEEIEGFGAGDPITVKVATYLIGYIFTEAGKEIKKVRNGKFGERGVPFGADVSFPDGGFLMVLRTVSDSENKYPDIAAVSDLISGAKNTPGGTLHDEILANTHGPNKSRINQRALCDALKRATSSKPVDPSDKVGFLAICPIVSLEGKPSGADDVYGIGLAGTYFPLLSGLRFSGEDSSLARRVAKSSEVMDLEIYGPHGSAFTTGVAKVPLVWSPPISKERARWITGDEIFSSLVSKSQKKQLKQFLSFDINERLKARQAFVAPSRGVRPLLRADYQVVEGGETTGWILKGVDKAKEAALGAVKSDGDTGDSADTNAAN